MVVGLSGRSRTTGQLLPAGLISRRVHHLRYPLHGGGGGVNRTASYSPTCPAREEEARVGVGGVVRKSRTYDDHDLQDHHDRRTHRHSSHTYRHGSRSSTPNNHDTARSSTPPTMFTRRDSTTATAKTPRTTTSTLADIVSGRASSSRRKSKTRESRGKASSSSSSGGGRAGASINASSSAAAVNHHGISSTSSPPNHPQHPFDEEDPSLQSSKKASTTRTNRLSPPQPDLIEIAYSYSLLEGDSVVTGDHESAIQDVVVDNDEKHATDEDEEIASPRRRLVHASSQQYGSRRQVPNLDTAKEKIARSISSSAEVLQRYQVELQSNNNSSRGTPMRLTKDDVQELVRAIHDISDCVNSLKNAVLPADAHHDQITMMKDVDMSLRARSSLSDSRDRRPRAGDASASSLSTSTNRSSNHHHHHHHSPTSAAAIYGKNLHRRGHRHHFPKESRQSSCEHSSYSNSSSNYGTVITPPLPRRSLPDFLLRQQETPRAANTSKRRLRSLSSTKPVGACTSSTRASTTVDVARPPNYRRATSLVATLSKASVSAEFLARTIQQQFKNSSSTNSKINKHSQLRRRAELQHDDDGDDDEDEIALHNDEEDELKIWQHDDDVPVMQNVNHDKKARNNIGTPETDATTTTTTSNSGPTHTNDLNRMNSLLFDNAISGGIADDNTNDDDDDDATRDFYQQQQQHDAESRSGSGSGGLAYQSFRPKCDERSRGRGGGVHSYYGMSTGKRRAPGVPCITTCLPVSNFYTDYVESFTNLKEHCSAATGINMNFSWEGASGCDFHDTTSNTGRTRLGRGGGGGRRGFTPNQQYPVSQCSSYSDDGQDHWLQYDEYDDAGEEENMNIFSHNGHYKPRASPVQRSSALYPTFTAATTYRRTNTTSSTMNSTSFRLPSPPNLGGTPTDEDEHDFHDNDDDIWLSSGRQGLDPAVVLQETLDNYQPSSATVQAACRATPPLGSSTPLPSNQVPHV